jgi:hypothetical protein
MSAVGRRLAYLIAWAVATAVTVGVAWLGIRSVLVAAAPDRIAPLSAADLREAAPKAAPTPAPVPSLSPSPTPPVSVAVGPTAKPTPTPSETWTPVPDGKGGTAYRRTFRTSGGDVVVLSARGDVKIESTKPKSGFTVNVARQSAESVVVSFFGTRKATRIWARWMNGPYAEVAEVTGFPT